MNPIKTLLTITSLVAALALALVAPSVDSASAAAPGTWDVVSAITIGCASSATGFNVAYGDIDPTEDYYQDTIVKDGAGDVYMDELVGPTTPSDTTWYLYDSNDRGMQTQSFPIPSPVTVIFTLRDSSMAAIYQTTLSLDCVGGTYSVISAGVPGASTGASAVPGPDMVPIPSGAVVGAVVSDTVAYFAPQADAATQIVIEAGKTLWVYGLDASGAYYKVMLAGRLFWLPASTLGPNYDSVWNGTPLPTTVVD